MQRPSVVLLFLTLLWPAVGAEAPVVRSVELKGSQREISLETRVGEPLNPDQLTRDVRTLWATGVFNDVRVERNDTAEGAGIVFRVVEKPRYYLREVKFAKGSEKRKIDIKAGGLIDEPSTGQVAGALRKQMVQEGYLTPKVEATLIPVGAQLADLELNLESGPRAHVQQVRFTGDLKMDPKELRRGLHALRSRRIIPGIWTSHPGYSEDAVQVDLARLRSLYLMQGYFDADVRLDDVDYKGKKTFVTVNIRPGDRYGIRRVEIVDVTKGLQTGMGVKSAQPEQDLCACLLKERKRAEKEGRLDFDVHLVADDVVGEPEEADGVARGGKWIDLSARFETGPVYTVGRIEFRGNHSFSESTLRRALVLDEAATFDGDRLRRSLVRLSQLGVFEPLTGADVELRRNPSTLRADVIINLKQKPRGGWSFSGPVGPVSLAGPLQASIASRLPGWGKGLLETSTYFLTFSVLGFPSTWTRLVPLMPNKNFLPLIIVERPYLPGQGWLSGFAVSPQLGWKGTAVTYGMSQTRRGLHWILGTDVPRVAELDIPVERRGADANKWAGRFLICEPHRSRWAKTKTGIGWVTDLVLGQRPF